MFFGILKTSFRLLLCCPHKFVSLFVNSLYYFVFFFVLFFCWFLIYLSTLKRQVHFVTTYTNSHKFTFPSGFSFRYFSVLCIYFILTFTLVFFCVFLLLVLLFRMQIYLITILFSIYRLFMFNNIAVLLLFISN